MQGNFSKGCVSVQNTKLESSRGCTIKAHIIKVYRLLYLLIQCQFGLLSSTQHWRLGRETNELCKEINLGWTFGLFQVRMFGQTWCFRESYWRRGEKKSVAGWIVPTRTTVKALHASKGATFKNLGSCHKKQPTQLSWGLGPILFFIFSPETSIKIHFALLFIIHLTLLLQKSS